MGTGADKSGPRLDDEMKKETEALERANREVRTAEEREQQGGEGREGSGHRLAGSGTSTDDHPHRDRGDEGSGSHPKP